MNTLKKAVFYSILLTGIHPVFADETGMPKPPAGYTWQSLPEIKGFVLRPEGYFYKTQSGDGTNAYFITKEDIGASGRFRSGLSVNVLRDLKKKKAVDLVKSYFAKYSKEKQILKSEKVKISTLEGIRFRFIDIDPSDNEKIRQEQLLLANKKTNTFYLILFEYPEKEAETEAEKGQAIMNMLGLDDDI